MCDEGRPRIAALGARWLRIALAGGALLILRPSPAQLQLAGHLREATRAFSRGDPQAGLDSLDAAIEIAPYLSALHIPAAHAALAIGQPDVAGRYLDAAGPLQAQGAFANCLRLEAALATGDDEIGLQEPGSYVGCPNAISLLTIMVQSQLNRNDLESAWETLSVLTGLLPEDVSTLRSFAILTAIVRQDDAPPSLRRLAEASPANRELARDLLRTLDESARQDAAFRLARIGQTLAHHGVWDDAARAFQEALRLQPGYAEALAYLGLSLDHLGSDGRAELDASVKAEPDSALAHAFLGLHWVGTGDLELAGRELQIARRLDPENPAFMAELGRLDAALGDMEGAKTALRSAADAQPEIPGFWQMLAEFSVQYEIEIDTIAIPAARNAVITSGGSAPSLDLLGYAYYLDGNLPLAERLLWRSVDVDPSNVQPAYHLGLVLLALDEPELAREALERAIRLDTAGDTAELARRILDRLRP